MIAGIGSIGVLKAQLKACSYAGSHIDGIPSEQ